MSSANAQKALAGHLTIPSDTIKNLKTGDKFVLQPGINETVHYTVLGADIVHHQHINNLTDQTNNPPARLTLATNYPFGRRLGDTPLRYVIYAALAR